MRGHTLFLAGAMIGALFSSSSANAQVTGPITSETWVCTEEASSDLARPSFEFLVQQGALIEQPLGAQRYQLLSNTVYGLVAVDYSTDLELGYVDVFVSTVMIDKISGDFVAASATSGKPLEQHAGKCRMLDGKTAPTIGAAAVSK